MKNKISFDEVLRKLKARGRPEQLAGMSRFGIVGEGRLGVAVPELRKLAKEMGKGNRHGR